MSASLHQALTAAAGLASEEGENPEYDRALAEVIVDTFGADIRDLDPSAFDDGMDTARPWVTSRIRSMTDTDRPTETWPRTAAERNSYHDWRYEVANGDTVLGFRDWLTNQKEND